MVSLFAPCSRVLVLSLYTDCENSFIYYRVTFVSLIVSIILWFLLALLLPRTGMILFIDIEVR